MFNQIAKKVKEEASLVIEAMTSSPNRIELLEIEAKAWADVKDKMAKEIEQSNSSLSPQVKLMMKLEAEREAMEKADGLH